MSKFTKQRIMSAFLSLLNKKSLDKLTVKDIFDDYCNETEKNLLFMMNMFELLNLSKK